jgi:hypothetical protein
MKTLALLILLPNLAQALPATVHLHTCARSFDFPSDHKIDTTSFQSTSSKEILIRTSGIQCRLLDDNQFCQQDLADQPAQTQENQQNQNSTPKTIQINEVRIVKTGETAFYNGSYYKCD